MEMYHRVDPVHFLLIISLANTQRCTTTGSNVVDVMNWNHFDYTSVNLLLCKYDLFSHTEVSLKLDCFNYYNKNGSFQLVPCLIAEVAAVVLNVKNFVHYNLIYGV